MSPKKYYLGQKKWLGLTIELLKNNLFNPNENSKIQDQARLNKRTIETLLNKLFILNNQDKNEEIIRQYANDNGITVT